MPLLSLRSTDLPRMPASQPHGSDLNATRAEYVVSFALSSRRHHQKTTPEETQQLNLLENSGQYIKAHRGLKTMAPANAAAVAAPWHELMKAQNVFDGNKNFAPCTLRGENQSLSADMLR